MDSSLLNNLNPVISALPEQELHTASATKKYPISSDMDSLLPDSFDLERLLPDNRTPNQGHSTNKQEAQKSAQGPTLPIVPPSIQDDPVLETIMRQAQMGLYAHPASENNSLNDTENKNSGKNSFLL